MADSDAIRNTWEHFEIKDDVWCILTLFETMFLKLELLWLFFEIKDDT